MSLISLRGTSRNANNAARSFRSSGVSFLLNEGRGMLYFLTISCVVNPSDSISLSRFRERLGFLEFRLNLFVNPVVQALFLDLVEQFRGGSESHSTDGVMNPFPVHSAAIPRLAKAFAFLRVPLGHTSLLPEPLPLALAPM